MLLLSIFMSIGLLNGVLAGLLGIGGGILSVPILFSVFEYYFQSHYAMHLAIGTSMLSIVFTSFANILAQHAKKAVSWHLWRMLVPGIALGSFFGTSLADMMDATQLRLSFACLVTVIAIRLFFFPSINDAHPRHPSSFGLVMLGIMIGTLAGLMGVGGATISVPIFLWLGLNIRQATATAGACVFPAAVMSTLMLLIHGLNESGLPLNCLGYIYWPASLIIGPLSILGVPLGVKMAHSISKERLTKGFGVFLFAVALKMFIR